ncbi:MAG: DNA methyltransferase [Candidatus Bathyarchaeota archaeon]|nr:DNA methyltransferase [Candidatus Bathyarchaeota archaeon]
MKIEWYLMLKNTKLVSFREMCPGIVGTRYSTHGLYTYPAQLIPQIPYYFFKQVKKPKHDSIVLDPFCGTGTVMVEAMHNGWNSVGIEINPVTALVAKVKATPYEASKLKNSFEKVKELYKGSKTDYTPPSFDNLNFWFTEKTTFELAKIKASIEGIENELIRDFFDVAFASIIKDSSRADPRIYVPVLPKKGLRKRRCSPWTLFKVKVETNIKKMKEFKGYVGNNSCDCQIVCGDCREVEKNFGQIDMIITSPPYISAQKYVRSTRLEAYWLGFSKDFQIDIDHKTIGSESITKSDYVTFQPTGINDLDELLCDVRSSDPVRAGIANKYFMDIKEVMEKMYFLLSSNGICVVVIGNSTLRGREVNTNEFLVKIAEGAGFELENIMLDKIVSKGLMTKRNKTAGSIDAEWVCVFKK